MRLVLVLAVVGCTISIDHAHTAVVTPAPPPPDPTAVYGRVLLEGTPVNEFALVLTPDASFPMFYEPARLVRSSDGRFSIPLGPRGPRDLIIVGRGFARRLVLRSTMESLLAKSGSSELGDIEVVRGNTIRGRVVDETGTPIAGAHVELLVNRVPAGHHDRARVLALGHRTTIADATGAYVLSNVAANVRQTGRPELRAVTAGRSSYAVPLPYGDATLDFELRRSGAIEVIGVPERAWVALSLATDPTIQVATFYEGDLVVARDVPEGSYIVTIYDKTTVSQHPITVSAGATVSLAVP